MSASTRVIVFLNAFVTALLAGILVDFWLFTAPALRSLGAGQFTVFAQALNREYLTPAPVLYTLVDVSAVLVVLARWRDRHRLPLLLSTLGLLLGAVATVTTLLINVPINADVLTWDPAMPPADWFHERDRWNAAHTFRTAMLVAALTFQLIAMVVPSGNRASDKRTGVPFPA